MKAVKDSVVYIAGEIFSKSIPFLLLPYLTRKLGVEGYGELANTQAFISLAIVFIAMSQQGAIARYFYFYGKRSIGLIVASGHIYSALVSLILLSIAYYTHSIIIFYATLTAFSQILLEVQLTLRQCQKQALSFITIQITNGILIVLITVALFEFVSPVYDNRILAIVFGNALSFLLGVYLYSTRTKLKLVFSMRNMTTGFSYLFVFGFPLIFHNLSFFLKGQFDRILIYEYFSTKELGIYVAGYQLASIFSILLLAVNKACIPYFYEGLKKQKWDQNDVIKWMTLSFVIVPIPAIVAFIIPEFVYTWILGSEYIGAKYFTFTFLLGLGVGLPYMILVSYLFYQGKNKQITYCSIASSFCYILLIYIFMNYDLKYVPFALGISNMVTIILLLRIVKKKRVRR